jgi:hypothetical protein
MPLRYGKVEQVRKTAKYWNAVLRDGLPQPSGMALPANPVADDASDIDLWHKRVKAVDNRRRTDRHVAPQLAEVVESGCEGTGQSVF